jgi:hypothetical protein
MTEEQIADIWTLFKEYLDKKHVEMAAERYVDLLADYGVSDHTLESTFGVDNKLDDAIRYYLEIDETDSEQDDDWD